MRKLTEIIESKKGNYRKLSTEGDNPTLKRQEKALATYVPFPDPAKIFGLDNIFEQASNVFGPYGGVYCEVYQNPQTNATLLEKSTDGHNYFNSLGFTARYIETILAFIREKTLYVSGHQGNTSRDGTTSLALVSSAVSKDLLFKRMMNPELFKVPSSVIKYTTEVVEKSFREIVEKNKNMVYDPITATYIGDGFKHALNAVSTTVDDNPILLKGFKDLMEECEEKGVDLTSSYKVSFQEKEVAAETAFKLKLNVGIRMSAEPFAQNKIASMKDYKAPVFILDGYIGDIHHNPFYRAFVTWVSELLKTKDENGFYLFSEHNPNGLKPPVFLYNRSTDKTMRMFSDLENYVTVTMTDSKENKTVKETIVPKFIYLQSEDIEGEQYRTFTEIFPESVIDLDGIRRIISDQARDSLTDEQKTDDALPAFIQDAINHNTDISHLLKPEDVSKLYRGLTLNLPDITYNRTITEDLKHNSVEKVEVKECKFDNLIATVAFDGSTLFVTPEADVFTGRIREKKEKVNRSLENCSSHSNEYEDLKNILSMFNTATITPMFYYKTLDEFNALYDLYCDAQGVFESVHIHGVMAGGNVTALRYMKELYKKTLAEIEETYGKKLNKKVADRYKEFAVEVLDSVYMGYYLTYKELLQEDETTVRGLIDQLQGEKKVVDGHNMASFDIVSCEWTKSILESTRSTVDIFSAATQLLTDMLLLRTVKINNERDVRELQNDFTSLERGIVVHPITAEYALEVQDEGNDG